jgi:uncharacterized membrane protein
MAAIAWYILSRAFIHHHGRDSTLAKAFGSDRKTLASIVLYVAAILLSFVSRWIALSIYASVAVMWLIPDRRIEQTLSGSR